MEDNLFYPNACDHSLHKFEADVPRCASAFLAFRHNFTATNLEDFSRFGKIETGLLAHELNVKHRFLLRSPVKYVWETYLVRSYTFK